MLVEILLRNRDTHNMRKIRTTYAEFDLRNLQDILQKVEVNEAIIQIWINADAYL